MPGTRTHREYTEKQKQASARSPRRKHPVDGVHSADPAGNVIPEKGSDLAAELNSFLINYDARLIEIDHKYPLGDPDRPEWLVEHRKNGMKRIIGIVRC